MFTILPREIMNQICKIVPGLKDLISYILCYEELIYEEENFAVYKDLGLLAHNRLTNLEVPEDD
jgi:hypothetical protein